MATKPVNIQNVFLNQARKENVPITVHLVNGFQIKGLVKTFDNFTVIVENMGKQQLLYKHAISTITPAKPVKLSFDGESETETAALTEPAPVSLTEPAQEETQPQAESEE